MVSHQQVKIIRNSDFSRAIECHPGNDKALLARGIINNDNLDQHQVAIDDFTAVLEIDPKHYEALTCRAVAKSNLGDYEDACQDYEAAIAVQPDKIDAYFHLGVAKYNMDDESSATQLFYRVLALNPQDSNSHLYLAKMTLDVTNRGVPLEHLTRAIQLDPQNVEAWQLRADLCLQGGSPELACEDFARALEIDGDNLEVLVKRSYALLMINELEKSKQSYQALLALDEDKAVVRHADQIYGLIALFEKDFGNVLSAFEKTENSNLAEPIEEDALQSLLHFRYLVIDAWYPNRSKLRSYAFCRQLVSSSNKRQLDHMEHTDHPLVTAIKEGNADKVMKALSHADCNPNLADNENVLPLNRAIMLGNEVIVSALLADPKMNSGTLSECFTLQCGKKMTGISSLHVAVEYGNPLIIRVLVEHNPDLLNSRLSSSTNLTPLMNAVDLAVLSIGLLYG